MQDTTVIENRLTRAGLDQAQVQAVVEENAADLDGFERWLDSVHDDDIKERYGPATDAEDNSSAGGRDGDASVPLA